MESPKQILCSSCREPIWIVRPMADGTPVHLPAQPSSPIYNPKMRQCPYCGQSIYMNRSRVLWRDEVSGRLRVA